MFVRAVLAFERRRAERLGTRSRAGAVTAIQRCGSALNTNVHFHTLVAPGVFEDEPGADVGATVAAPARNGPQRYRPGAGDERGQSALRQRAPSSGAPGKKRSDRYLGNSPGGTMLLTSPVRPWRNDTMARTSSGLRLSGLTSLESHWFFTPPRL